MRPLHLALVWHLHQPYYKDDLTDTYLLPWVRLRSTKDYIKMADLAAAYPGVRQTFNLVPSLLRQIEDTAFGDVSDVFLSLSRKAAAELTAEDRTFLLRWMRESPRFLRVQASPRYAELAARDDRDTFTVEEVRDLQVWCNLAWYDPARVERDSRLSELKIKDRGFTEADKEVLFQAQLEVVGQVIDRDGEGRLHEPELLYQPWRIERDGRSVSVVFRDNPLSNAIGFDYHGMHARDAVADFTTRLRRIRDQQGDDRDFLAVVALDGENPWDFYSREGHDFLNWLYEELQRAEDIRCTTVSDFLDQHPDRNQLDRLHSGSWIGASFDTWIGGPEHNHAWDMLAETRDWLGDHSERYPQAENLDAAWRELRIVEGSDWFWWFSRRHDSGMDAIWDNQFRLHLRNVYKLLDAKPPTALFRPILKRGLGEELRPPSGSFTPAGADDPDWEEKAGRYDVGGGFGALHKPVDLVSGIRYASDHERLYVRIDSARSAEQLAAEGVAFWLYLSGEAGGDELGDSFAAPVRPGTTGDFGFDPGTVIKVEGSELVVGRLHETLTGAVPVARETVGSPLCFSVPFARLERLSGEPLQLALVVTRNGREVERVPPVGALGLPVPRGAELASYRSGRPLRVLITAAEVSPFAKAGGVADVPAALATEPGRQGHAVRLVVPRYRSISPEAHGLEPAAT